MTPSPASRSWLSAILTVLVDQCTKHVVRHWLMPGQSVPLLPSVLHLTYVQNTGAAFGLFKGMTSVLTILSGLVAVWLMLELRRPGAASAPRSEAGRLWALSLILGGAVGNLIDRVRLGYVVDFIDLRVWPVFNVADSVITIGVTWLLLPLLWKPQRKP